MKKKENATGDPRPGPKSGRERDESEKPGGRQGRADELLDPDEHLDPDGDPDATLPLPSRTPFHPQA